MGVKHAFDPPFPCSVEIDSWNIGKHFNSAGVVSDAKKAAAIGEILRTDVLERRAKCGQRCVRGLCVGRVRFNEQINVLFRARLGVKDDRVAPYNEIFNAMGMECGQKVFVILVHPAPAPNL